MPVVIAALSAFAVTVILEPLVIRGLRKRSVLDLPSARSNHAVPTLRGGGIAVVAGICVGVAVSGELLAFALLGGIFIAAGVGAVEDLRGLPIASRLLLVTVAGLALVAALIANGGATGPAGVVVLLLAVPWTLAVVNAVNFMDGINGISATTAIIGGIAYAWLGWANESGSLTALGLVLAAAGLGFAPFNVPRARVFLGDVGSYGIGATFAALSLLAVVDGVPLVAAVAPLALYLADTAATILRRVAAREPWLRPHNSHTYQRLVALGMQHVSVSALVGAITAGCAALGAISMIGSSTATAAAVVAIAVVVGVYLVSPQLLSARTRGA